MGVATTHIVNIVAVTTCTYDHIVFRILHHTMNVVVLKCLMMAGE